MKELRREIVAAGAFLYDRGLAFATNGNLSARSDDSILITPTGVSLAGLRPSQIARVRPDGARIGEAVPSKELPFHLAIYRVRTDAAAVVHLHSHYATAVACLRDLDVEDALAPLTPYYVMSVGRLPVVGYFPPGDERLGAAVAERAPLADALLLRNHGLITYGPTLAHAIRLAEEIEATARLALEIGERARVLGADEVNELRRRFPRNTKNGPAPWEASAPGAKRAGDGTDLPAD